MIGAGRHRTSMQVIDEPRSGRRARSSTFYEGARLPADAAPSAQKMLNL
ncbi:MAG: hypothetical protein MZV65_48965 [Chromatiales bacterium]|nr:hypothetical protein [Chromatiales bacterium]